MGDWVVQHLRGMDFVDKFNVCEGFLWIVVAVALFANAVRLKKPKRTMALVAGVSFFLFGLTDFAETTTDSWPPPWWLMLWKNACGIGFISMYLWYLQVEGKLPEFVKKLLAKKPQRPAGDD